MSTWVAIEGRRWAFLLGVALVTSGCAAHQGTTNMNASNPPAAGVDQTDDGLTLNPFHAVVRSKILNAFEGLTKHDPAPALSVMADDVHYTFDGEHALGGTRVTRAGVEKWFGRLFRLSPGRFVIRHVEVSGWPWSARAETTFEHQVTPPDGEPYWATAVQVAELDWGTAVRIRTTVLDMGKLVATLNALAVHGNQEAAAPQILE
jgi:ketosteroid isomerase-like protein